MVSTFYPILRYALVFVSMLLVSPGLTRAQETSPDTLRAELEAIQIQATHSSISTAHPPLSLSMVRNTTAELTHRAPITLDELFTDVPGIWINDRENFALGERMMVRGIGWRAQFGVRGIQVVMDGIPLTMADGQAMLTVVDPAFIRKAELIRGPSSMFWGNSSGGVLYLNSTAPANTQSPLMLRGTVGSFGLKKSDIQFSHNFGKHSLSGYATYMVQNGYRDHSAVTIGRAGVTGSIDLSADSRLEYFGAYADMPRAQHPSGLTAEQALEDPTQANQGFQNLDAGKQIAQGQIGVSLSQNSSFGFLEVTAYGTYRTLDNPLPFAIIDLNRRAGGARITMEKDLGAFSLNAGLESKLQRDDRTEFDNDATQRGAVQVDQLERVFNQAAFATTTYTHDRISLHGSLRYDWIRFKTDTGSPLTSGQRDFQAVSPGIGANYQIGDIELFGNFSTGFEVPTTTELVNRPGGGNGFNPDIEPEKTIGGEIGSRGTLSGGRLSYDLALYNLWISDLLFPYQLQANGPTYYRNQGETVHRGVEARVGYQLSSDIRTGITYTLTRARFEQATTVDGLSLEDKEVPGVPEHRVAADLAWNPGDLRLSADVEYVGKYTVNNLNTAYNDSYLLVDTRISYEGLSFGGGIRATPFLTVNNLLDTRYNGSVVVNAFGGRYFEPGAGIHWRSGFSLRF